MSERISRLKRTIAVAALGAAAIGIGVTDGAPVHAIENAGIATFGDPNHFTVPPKEGVFKTYTVKKGDTEWEIARETDLDPSNIQRVEDELITPQISGKELLPGQTLRFPLNSAVGEELPENK